MFGTSLGLALRLVRAGGAETSAPAMVYSGTLLENGKVVSGDRSVQIELWDDENSPDASAHRKCVSTPKEPTHVVDGRFRVVLDSACSDAARSSSSLWVDVRVDGRSLGRTRAAAVPLAVRATAVPWTGISDLPGEWPGAVPWTRVSGAPDTMRVALRYSTGVPQPLASRARTILNFDSKDYATHPDAVTVGENWKFVAPIPGRYRIDFHIEIGPTNNPGAWASSELFKNGEKVSVLGEFFVDGPKVDAFHGIQGSDTVALAAGDSLAIQVYLADEPQHLTPARVTNYVVIERMGPLPL